MNHFINVYVLPVFVTPSEMAGDTVVVIDVLRATTTISHALAAGATEVIPCLEVEDALREAERFARHEVVLGGERGGLPIDGFDLGNSPEEYNPETVEGKTVIFTTTNGTRAIHHCSQAADVLLAAFVNASRIVELLMDRPRIHILCAGTDGRYSSDDLLVAGLLVDRLDRTSGLRFAYNAQAIAAKETWNAAFALPYAIGAEPLPPEMLARPLRESLGGRNLVQVGLERDILTAARIDALDVAPRLDLETFHIRGR